MPPTPEHQPEKWSTSDLALVAWLRYHGVEPCDCKWGGHVCYFYFSSEPEEYGWVSQLREELDGGEITVDLRRYNQIFGATKQEMFAAERVSA